MRMDEYLRRFSFVNNFIRHAVIFDVNISDQKIRVCDRGRRGSSIHEVILCRGQFAHVQRYTGTRVPKLFVIWKRLSSVAHYHALQYLSTKIRL